MNGPALARELARAEWALSVRDLRVEAPSGLALVESLSIDLAKGEVLGIVGESGSGKTTTALAALGMAHPGVRLMGGTLVAQGRNFDLTDVKSVAALRGRYIAYVPQSPGTALNPVMRVDAALKEMLRRTATHSSRSSWDQSIAAVLEKVNLPRTPDFRRRFPHQLSGGQQQRVCIAMALLSGAGVIFLDEPTTGLDVITQQTVISELSRLRRDLGLSMVYISHDLAVVAQVADRVAVMYAGAIVELGPVGEVLQSPAHPYTRGLLASTLDFRHPRDVQPIPGSLVRSIKSQPGCAFAPRCSLAQEDCRNEMPTLRRISADGSRTVSCLHPAAGPVETFPVASASTRVAASSQPILSAAHLRIEYLHRGQAVAAVSDVSFAIDQGKCLALLGESGSGKSTIARAVVGLKAPASGKIRLDGVDLARHASGRSDDQRRRLQMVFQNSAAALNPRESVRTAIERSMARRRPGNSTGDQCVEDLLSLVRLPTMVQHRIPSELSGGERQRVCIARALATSPDVLVCDEITSALDVSVQASVLKLLKELQSGLGLSLLFITHDMGVVSYLADSVIVLERGRVCEAGLTSEVLNAPGSDYARRLMNAVPALPLG